MTRESSALDVGRKAYHAAMEIINEESPDMGVAFAACAYVRHWLQAEADANMVLGISKFASTANPNEGVNCR